MGMCYVANEAVFLSADQLQFRDDTQWLDNQECAREANDDGHIVVLPGVKWTRKRDHV
jgi:hypothetical protein